MDAYDPTNWTGLFGAEISASAALTGLIFVAVSINLSRILEFPALPGRAFKALFMFVDVLFISTIVLVPGQPVGLLGAELAVLGLGVLGALVVRDVTTWRLTQPEFRQGMVVLASIGAASALATTLAGISLLGHAGGGLYWLVPGVLLAFTAALAEAWVLLIEIVR